MNLTNLCTSECAHSFIQQRRDRKRFFRRLIPLRRRFTSETGSALIEFALSVPILFMLLIGFCQVCVAIYSNFCITEMARDTARWASVRGSNSCADAPGMDSCDATAADIQAEARKVAYPGIDTSKISVSTAWLQADSTDSVTWSACTQGSAICNAPGNAVQVTLSYPFPIDIPMASSENLNFSATSQIVIVQ